MQAVNFLGGVSRGELFIYYLLPLRGDFSMLLRQKSSKDSGVKKCIKQLLKTVLADMTVLAALEKDLFRLGFFCAIKTVGKNIPGRKSVSR